MRISLLALPLVSVLCLAGCAKGPAERLSGRWVGESIDNIPPEQEARATGWVKATSFEFRGDKLTVTVPAEDPRTGTFKVDRVQGQKLTLLVTRPNGDTDEAVVTFTGENAMKWDIGNDRAVKLTRIAAQLPREQRDALARTHGGSRRNGRAREPHDPRFGPLVARGRGAEPFDGALVALVRRFHGGFSVGHAASRPRGRDRR